MGLVNESWESVLNKVDVNKSALESFKVINTEVHNCTKQRKTQIPRFQSI